MFHIRKIEETDYYKGYFNLLSQLTDAPEIELSLFKELIKDTNTFVIEDNNKIIASITVLIERKFIHGGRGVTHIEDVVVDKDYRGKGIGKLLLNKAKNEAEKNYCYKLILNCKDKLVPFYEKNGFELKGCQMIYINYV